MSTMLRRYEVLFPIRLNDGERTPKRLVGDAFRELAKKFGARRPIQVIRGRKRRKSALHRDEPHRVCLDVPDTKENRAFFVDFKKRLKARYRQIDIWMTTYRVESV